ncbi:MAG: BACON domain-containing protein, partial [Muribaculaceae bacterium]|nr:BACON domain-containing protein [Muribaculaceae bacterium]
MKTKNIFGLIVAFAIMITGMAVGGCCDNLNKEFEPISSANRTLTINGSPRDTTITLTAGAATRTINVKSNTRWTVRVIDGGGWCTTDVMSGRGDESFTISVMENTGQLRKCNVEISAVDAEGQQDNNRSLVKTVNIVQTESSVRINPSSLESLPATEDNMSFEIIANAEWTLDISYENENTPHFLSITPGTNMEQTGENEFSGSENARFSLHVAANGSDASRVGYLNLRPAGAVAPYTVEIRQNKSEYTFDVSAERRTVEPQGGTITFGVLSQSEWTVSSSDPQVRFSPDSGIGNGRPETTIATFPPNLTDTVRTVRVRFVPAKENFVPQEVTVTQQPFTMIFNVSRGSLPGVVTEVEESTYTINVASTFKWSVANTPDWVTVTPDNGDGSLNNATLSVKIARNVTDSQRPGTITVEPLPTEFYDDIEIDPRSVGIMPYTIHVIQYGGQQPAISVPWVSDGITQEEAVLKFNYYSPYVAIDGAGLEWRKVGDTEWKSETATITDSNSGTLTIRLSGLNPVTRYEARGYVMVGSQKIPGSATEGFTTAGRYPDTTDN